MKTVLLKLVLAAVMIISLAPLAGADQRKELKNIPLEWRPTVKIDAGEVNVTRFGKATFSVAPATDARDKPEEIGKNIEKRGTERELPVTTKENVAAWLTYRFGQALSELGVNMAPNNATFRIETEIRKFYVVESSTYKAEVGLKIKLLSKAGAVVWEGMVSGSASRFGASYKADNYYEALSDAVMTAIGGLLKNEDFRQAVMKNM